MRPAKTLRQFERPITWQDIASGQWIAEQLQQRLDTWCPQLFGYHLIKLGSLSSELNTHSSTIRHQVSVSKNGDKTGLFASSQALPIQASTIDACILTHGLDFSSDPHQVLREIERVLTADGCLILSGFNPFSWVGLGRLLPFVRHKSPWNGRMFTPARVRDWLHLLGFEILADEAFGFGFNAGRYRILQCIEHMAQRYMPVMCDNYFIVAKKRTHPLTPVKEKWRLKPRLISVPVTNCRSGNPHQG